MKYRLFILLFVFPLIISQLVWGAERNENATTVFPLPFDKAAPLPGALVISGDGNTGAHIDANGDVFIWDASKLQLLETIPAHDKKPSAVALSTDGNLFAIGYSDSRLIVGSRLEKRTLRELYGHSGSISALTFSSDGKLLASGGSDGTTQLWEVNAGKRLQVFDSMFNGDISEGYGIPVSIDFSGDGQVLIVNEWYSRFYDVGRSTTIWDIKDGTEISFREVAPPSRDNVMRKGQALGGKGWLLAFTGHDGLMVDRLDLCAPPRRMPSGGFAETVAADPQGRWVAAMADQEITFFAVNSDNKDYHVTLPAKVIALVPHPDGRSVFALTIAEMQTNSNEYFIFGRDAETVTVGALYRIPVPAPLWDAPTLNVKESAAHCAVTETTHLQQNYKLPGKPHELPVIANLSLTTTKNPDNPTAKYNQINPPRELYFDHERHLYALYGARSSDFGSFGSGVAVWDVQTKRLVRSNFKRNIGDTTLRLKHGWGEMPGALQNILTGKSFFQERIDNSQVMSDMDTGEVFRFTDQHVERYSSDGRRLKDVITKGTVMSVTARNGRLAALSRGGDVQVWQLVPRGKSKTYKLDLEDDAWAGDLALSADGRYLHVAFLNASGDGPTRYSTYRLNSATSVESEVLLAPLPGRANRGVFAGNRPHRLIVWDFDKGSLIARLPRQRSRDKSGVYVPLLAAISDNGRLLASASYDGLVRIWDIDAHRMIGEGRLGGEVTAIAFDAAGRRLAAGRRDGQIVVFQVSAPK